MPDGMTQIAARIRNELYDQLRKERDALDASTGVRHSMAQVISMVLERGLSNGKKKRA